MLPNIYYYFYENKRHIPINVLFNLLIRLIMTQSTKKSNRCI